MSKPVILCVDDEPGILKSLERCLLLEDYEVLSACGGHEALDLMAQREGRVDLMIVDHRMPRMMGHEFLAQVQAKYGPKKAIMLSGYTDFKTLVKAVSSGQIFHFIQKPWDNKELFQVVRDAVAPEGDKEA